MPDKKRKPVGPCRCCGGKNATRPRQLCWHCYYQPGNREHFASTSKYGNRGVPDRRRSKRCKAPTDALPGSPEKIAVLQARCLAGEDLWHRDDPMQAGVDVWVVPGATAHCELPWMMEDVA